MASPAQSQGVGETDPIPVGDIAFYDNEVPAIEGGIYWINVSHELVENGAPINDAPIGTAQALVVTAPHFALPAGEIVSRHPADASSGAFGGQLPHIVFQEPALPWERAMATKGAPWLALMVFTGEELLGGADSPTRTQTTTVSDFLQTRAGVCKPRIEADATVDMTSPCAFIEVSTTTFASLAPRGDELAFLAHCRQADLSDKATKQIDPNGFFSVVVANRFPARPSIGSTATKNIVHLVSMEGLETLIVETPDFGQASSVALVTLASWTFQCVADAAEDFRGLVDRLVTSETDDRNDVAPQRLSLALPPPAPQQGDVKAQAQVSARLAAGFVPMPYHTRSGESTFAWYRGPLTPVLTESLDTKGPFLTADAASIFQEDWGVFDLSLAAAWTAGRAAALSDKAFGKTLYDLRRCANQAADRLQTRSGSKASGADPARDTTARDAFRAILDTELLARIGGPPVTPSAPSPAPETTPPDPKAELQALLANSAIQSEIIASVADDLAIIAAWLGRLLLLHPLPFDLLVPDARLLPTESLRFFYLDRNWTDALLDGALSIGLESSRQVQLHALTRDHIRDTARTASMALRKVGSAQPAPENDAVAPISGLLLRSSLVSGWPTLAVRPYDASGGKVKVLRMDRLSPTVLLCLFSGIPDRVEISEPQEGFAFGVDDDGMITLRSLAADPSVPGPGRKIGSKKIYDPTGKEDLYTRSAGTRVLKIAPGDANGLVAAVATALATVSNTPAPDLGPATFALQMIKAPEAIAFTSGSLG